MIGAMTERASGGIDRTIVCPFLAFGDDREYRGSVPDHRHRCFADSPAAPRALAHQAAYCLTGSFTGCPTFVDWARRESAPARDEPPLRPRREPPGSPRLAGREQEAPPFDTPPPRSGRDAGWASPPPWGTAARSVGEGQSGEHAAAGRESGPGEGRWPDEGGPGGPQPERPYVESGFQPAVSGDEEAPAFLADRARSRASVPPQSTAEQDESTPAEVDLVGAEDEDAGQGEEPARAAGFRPAGPANRRAPVGYAGLAGGGRTQQERASDPDAPSWERPRRFEAYPTIRTRTRLPAIPRLGAIAILVAIAGFALFLAPALLRNLIGGGTAATPQPTQSATPSAKPSPTAVAAPTPLIYVVKSGDLLSKIATKYHVTVDQILTANPSIKNRNLIKPGDRITIPLPLPSEIVDNGGAITPAPTPP
jgi:LysM repeat protein